MGSGNLPRNLLPWLAWSFSVDNWNSNWDVRKKRDSIKVAFETHSRKGTRRAVRAGLDAVNRPTQVIEWFEPEATRKDPHTFEIRVDVPDEGITDQHYEEIVRIVDSNKPVRSHYAIGVWSIVNSHAPHCGSTTCCGESTTIYPYSVNRLEQNTATRYGCAQYIADTTTIYPLGRTQ